MRGLDNPNRRDWSRRWFGRSPRLAAGSIFLGGALMEFSQLLWPKGLFAGIFDPLDLLMFTTGIGVCFLLERPTPDPAV